MLILSSEQKAFMDKITNQIKSYKLEISEDDNNDSEEMSDCGYYNIEQFKKRNSQVQIAQFCTYTFIQLNVTLKN